MKFYTSLLLSSAFLMSIGSAAFADDKIAVHGFKGDKLQLYSAPAVTAELLNQIALNKLSSAMPLPVIDRKGVFLKVNVGKIGDRWVKKLDVLVAGFQPPVVVCSALNTQPGSKVGATSGAGGDLGCIKE